MKVHYGYLALRYVAYIESHQIISRVFNIDINSDSKAKG